MKFYSTRSKSKFVDLSTAVLSGLAPDGGLYLPETISKFSAEELKEIKSKDFPTQSFHLAKKLLGDAIPDENLLKICQKTVAFDAPTIPLFDNIYTLELFHGPTMAFKDFGGRFMANLTSYFLTKLGKKITILVATSGDTGSAVAQGFLNAPLVDVIILYPKGKVSLIQEQQLTTCGGNITALEIDGTFDDCQKLVKSAFSDEDLRSKINLSSANSINIARLVPQGFYYLKSYLDLDGKEIIFSVPSGNFGNLCAGILAKKAGVPINNFIASTNANSVVPEYLETGEYKPRQSVSTISNAMDVGNPSNFERLSSLLPDVSDFLKEMTGVAFDDQTTKEAMVSVYKKTGYIMDPHGAVGYLGLMKNEKVRSGEVNGVFLETAHPAKFIETVEETLKTKIEIPARLQEFLNREKKAINLGIDYADFKEWLLANSL